VTRARLIPILAVAAVVIVAAALVALTLRQPSVAMYTPTPPAPRDVGRALVGPVVYTVDATDSEQWRHFSFAQGSVVEDAERWDLAFRRYQILANGGPHYPGKGGIRDLGDVRFDDVRAVPDTDYVVNEKTPDPRNPAIVGWYSYGFFSHVLKPKPRVWAIRTADGRFAKMEIVSYYCPQGRPGCVTFRYVFQGSGTTSLTAHGRQF
jgi:hypothetical protein